MLARLVRLASSRPAPAVAALAPRRALHATVVLGARPVQGFT